MSRNFSWFVQRILPWVTLAHVLLFLAFWLTNSTFYTSSNDYVTGLLGRRMDYVSLLLWVSAFIAIWSGLMGTLGSLRQAYQPPVLLSWVYAVVSVIYLIFFYATLSLLFKESPAELPRIGQLIGYFRIIIDPILLLGLALLAAFWVRKLLAKNVPRTRAHQKRSNEPDRPTWPLLAVPIVGYTILWGLALVFTPTDVFRGTLPNKPLLIAHRGAAMLAPENTLAAANLAAELKITGLETDIQVSKDGQLFLLHDGTFARTTDIASIFPGRQDEPAGNFTIDEIKRLNAGKWFVEQDPFHAIRRGLVTPEQVQEYQQQSVALLSDWIPIIKQHNLVFIFDLEQLPADNPYIPSIFGLTLQQLLQARLGPLAWIKVNVNQLRILKQLAPEMVPTYSADFQSPPSAARLGAEGYLVIDVEYGLGRQWIKRYHDAGVWVNMYTVDETWQFSRLWIMGVDSITTNNVQVMNSLTHPLLSLPFNRYVVIWSAVGLVGLALLVGLVYPRLKPPG